MIKDSQWQPIYAINNKDYEWEAELLGAYHKLNHAENELEKQNFEAKSIWTKYDAEFHQMLIKLTIV